MKIIGKMLRESALLIGEFRGGKGETARRLDKSEKGAPPIEFSMYKFTLEFLEDGSPLLVTVYLEESKNAEQFAASVPLTRGDIVAVRITKLEMKNGVRHVRCSPTGFVALDKPEADQLRSAAAEK